MDDIYLAEPAACHRAQAIAYKRAYIEHGETHINGSLDFMGHDDYDAWLNEVNAAHERLTTPMSVPATTYFTIRRSDRKIIGSIQLRHELDDDLIQRGGHIGYGICPDERKKGYGTRQLALVLEKARALGLKRVMISCDKTNAASARVAMNNGAHLTWEGHDSEDGDIKVFWIEL